MNSYHWRRRLGRAVVTVAGLLVLGYVSSFLSLGRRESLTAERVARELGTRDLFVLANDGSSSVDYPGSAAILRKSGFNVRSCEGAETRLDCFPWAGVARAKMVYPFVVDVRWGYVAGPTIGAGTRTRYLTFFGAALSLMDTGDWPFAV
jgi:hypothetical protein